MTTRICCDGSKECAAPLTLYCTCRRCESEGDDHEGRFHACSDPIHRELAVQRHERVFERPALFAPWDSAPGVQGVVERAAQLLRSSHLVDGFLIVAVQRPVGDTNGAIGGLVAGTIPVAALSVAAQQVLTAAATGAEQHAEAQALEKSGLSKN